MAMMDLAKPIHIALRIIQLAWATVVMALIGNMIADRYNDQIATVNYCLFTAAFTMATMFYLMAAACDERFMIHPSIMFFLDVLNSIFAFCAAIALPSKLRVHSCSNEGYTMSNSVTRDTPDGEKTCREAQAATAFLWFLWATFVFSAILSALSMRGSMVDMRGPRPGRRTQPSMSQV